ncbi:MAG: type II and III secretion system protein [Methylomonas sp.]|nr:MAG: type II and III secretion system protein [Methylomonas sp.]PPD27867.1 MAG: type II and III secretion system protein [Methylomonas sp.]PPD39977.1 MAG: type II and III secretion system protein [Methylomonas sp.]PPD41043.1 MAG: type II and III secretion system protein [Methylomonas sp.]PPD52029.1 MAG: type II and III secretion system protein [Methylomonas sp.]
MKSRRWVWLLAWAVSQVMASETVMDIIATQNRPASEVAALIQPMLEADDRIVADGFNLIIRAPAERIEAIRQLVQQIDKRQRNLVITVLQDSHNSADELNARAAIGLSGQGVQMRGFVADTRDIDQLRTTQHIRTLEGQAAHIRVGQVRMVDRVGIQGFPFLHAIPGGQPVEASTGFAVVPRLSGTQDVMIHIAPWSDRFMSNGALAIQSAQTSLRIRLGDWVELGGSGQQTSSQNQGLDGFNATTDIGARYILIKVDLAD